MLIDSVIELVNISVISKDGQEINHSQWLALPQGWGAAKPVPGRTAVPGVCMRLPKWTWKSCHAPLKHLCPLEQGNGARETGLVSSGCSLEGT